MKIKILALVVIFATCLFFVVSQFGFYYYLFPNKFDSYVWKNSYEKFINYPSPDGAEAYQVLSDRKEMVYDLIRSKDLVGKNKDFVINVLGLEENDKDLNVWTYWLAFTASDNKWLSVLFDSKGLVVSLKITED